MDTGTYDLNNPVITPDTASESVTIERLEEIFLTNPIVNKAITVKANKVMGNGFDLVPVDGKDIKDNLALEAKELCEEFHDEIGYVTFYTKSCKNAYTAGNEWTELVYNGLEDKSLIYLAHGDFRTIDFQRDYINNKILTDKKGNSVGFWQYIPDLSQFCRDIQTLYGSKEAYENLEATKERFEESHSYHEVKGEDGEAVGVLFNKPNYMFLKKDEIAHLSFDSLNDNPYGTSLILAAYNSLMHLDMIQYAIAEAINTIGFPKMVIYVGDENHSPTDSLNDQAEDAIEDPVRKEGWVLPYFMKAEYLQSGNLSSDIANYPEYYVEMACTGLRIPKELLIGSGEANRSNSMQGSTDFEKDIESDRRKLEEYVYTILDRYLQTRPNGAFKTTDGSRTPYVPKIRWERFVTEDQALREKMIMEKWSGGLISFNEAREMLKLTEIEKSERGEKFFDELKGPEPEGLGGWGNMMDEAGSDTSEMPNEAEEEIKETEQTAKHRLDNKSELNSALNKEFKTEDVDYKKIAQKNVGKKIVSVDLAKARKIRDIFINGMAKKKSAKFIQNEIRKVGDYKDYEIKRITRTEMANLRENADFESATKEGYKYKKWKSRMDKETTNLCKALHGQVRKIDEDFRVGYMDEQGKRKMWNGKTSPAHANCRSKVDYYKDKPR